MPVSPRSRCALLAAAAAAATACANLDPIDTPKPTRVAFETRLTLDDTNITESGTRTSNTETSSFEVDALVGHRIGGGIVEPGFLLAYERADIETTTFPSGARSDASTAALRLGGNLRLWLLDSGPVQPWAEATLGGVFARIRVQNDTEDAVGVFVRGGVGLSSFVSESVSVDVGLRLAGQSVEADGLDVDVDSAAIAAFVGFSTYF